MAARLALDHRFAALNTLLGIGFPAVHLLSSSTYVAQQIKGPLDPEGLSGVKVEKCHP